MAAADAPDGRETSELLARARGGDERSLGQLLQRQRAALERFARRRLDRRVARRVDAGDIVQEVLAEAAERVRRQPPPALPFRLWLRLLAGQRVLQTHRRHLGAARRDARREWPLAGSGSRSGPQEPVDPGSAPSSAARRREAADAVHAALAELPEELRRILALRHFERLSNAAAARALGMSESGASHRYAVALTALRQALGPDLPEARR